MSFTREEAKETRIVDGNRLDYLKLIDKIFDSIDEVTYREKFISYMMGKSDCKRELAVMELEALIESNGKDMDYSEPHFDADECMSAWQD